MLVYILSNTTQTLGVFSTPLEAQKYYSTLHLPLLSPVKLQEFTLNGTSGKDMTLFLSLPPVFHKKHTLSPRNKNFIFEPPFSDTIYECDNYEYTIYECDNCGGEDCRDGCVNDNYDF